MKKTALISSGYSFFCGCIVAAILLNGLPVTAQPFKFGAVNDMDRVFEDGYKLPVICLMSGKFP